MDSDEGRVVFGNIRFLRGWRISDELFDGSEVLGETKELIFVYLSLFLKFKFDFLFGLN